MKTSVKTAYLGILVVLLATLSTQSLHAQASLSLNGANQYVQVPPNPNFTPTFSRLLFAVVNSPQGTIPSNLKKYFGPTGFICTNTKAKNHLKKYGFLVLPNGGGPGQCGHAQ